APKQTKPRPIYTGISFIYWRFFLSKDSISHLKKCRYLFIDLKGAGTGIKGYGIRGEEFFETFVLDQFTRLPKGALIFFHDQHLIAKLNGNFNFMRGKQDGLSGFVGYVL